MQENYLGQATGQKTSRKAKPEMDWWNDEGCRKVGSQELEGQGQRQRWLEAASWVGQDPAWVVAPGSEWVSFITLWYLISFKFWHKVPWRWCKSRQTRMFQMCNRWCHKWRGQKILSLFTLRKHTITSDMLYIYIQYHILFGTQIYSTDLIQFSHNSPLFGYSNLHCIYSC